MKKFLFLADLHGNLPAAEAMGRYLDTAAADEIWFLGDAVGKGPSNAETCDWVRQRCHHFIGGNWDYGIGGREYAGDQYYYDQLGEERMQWLNSLSREAELWLSGIRFRLFHGRPLEPLLTQDSDKDALNRLFTVNGKQYGGVIFADSHRPFFRTHHAGYLMNTGSVGNSMGVTNAHALMIEAEPGTQRAPLTVSIISVPYDNERAADIARRDPSLPNQQAYIHEVMTGVYSRVRTDG